MYLYTIIINCSWINLSFQVNAHTPISAVMKSMKLVEKDILQKTGTHEVHLRDSDIIKILNKASTIEFEPGKNHWAFSLETNDCSFDDVQLYVDIVKTSK